MKVLRFDVLLFDLGSGNYINDYSHSKKETVHRNFFSECGGGQILPVCNYVCL
jgi:hypothetical protein